MSRVPIRLPSRSKYNAVPTVVDGIRFASKHEAKVYSDLRLLEKQGHIRALCADKKQLRFPLEVNGILICVYEGDFSFYEVFGDLTWSGRIVADAKGVKTPVYRLKKKLMKALYGIEIREV